MKCIVLLLAATFSINVQAAARCVNSAGAVVGYADTAAACPTGSRFKGEVAPMPAAAASDVNSAQAQAARDQQAVDALEKTRLKEEREARAAAKAQLAAQNKGASKAKSCKAAELALKRAKDRYDDSPSATVKQKKASKNSKTQTHVVVREGDGKAGKARKKAQHALEAAQGKRDLACS